jgi:hypothetical protein
MSTEWDDVLEDLEDARDNTAFVRSGGSLPDKEFLPWVRSKYSELMGAVQDSHILLGGRSFGDWVLLNFGQPDPSYRQGVRTAGAALSKAVLRDDSNSSDVRVAYDSLVEAMDKYFRYAESFVSERLRGPERFTYEGFRVENPDRLADHVVKQLLDSVDYTLALFKKRGALPVLQESVRTIILKHTPRGSSASGLYHKGARTVTLMAEALRTPTAGRFLQRWIHEVFLHEIGHHIHMDLLPSAARQEWDSGWAPIEEAKARQEKYDAGIRRVTLAERKRYWDLLTRAKGNLRAIRLEGLDRMKFHAWLREPTLGDPFVTEKQLRWTRERGEALRQLIENPQKYMEEERGLTPRDSNYEKVLSGVLRQRKNILAVLDGDNYAHPLLTESQVEIYAKADPEVARTLEQMSREVTQAVDSLGAPSDYAKTNNLEDFAETFTLFMEDPSRLTPRARFRMQRALSLSGLYGKPIMRLATRPKKMLKAAGEQVPPGFLEGSKYKDILYHGSNKRLSTGHGLRPDQGSEYGIYLTPSHRYARMYGSNLYSVLANFKKPLVVEGKYEISPQDLTREDIRKLQAQGYDSIVSKSGSRIDEVVLFRSEQAWVLPEARTASETLILRPDGWQATSDEGAAFLSRLKRPGALYRGMDVAEYKATVGSRKPLWSTGAFSFASEGANFAEDPADAESYANFGRGDPRKTGKPTYLVEVRKSEAIPRERDGYYKAPAPLPYSEVLRVWEMAAEDGAIVMKQVKSASRASRIATSLPKVLYRGVSTGVRYTGFDWHANTYLTDDLETAAIYGRNGTTTRVTPPKVPVTLADDPKVREIEGSPDRKQAAETLGVKAIWNPTARWVGKVHPHEYILFDDAPVKTAPLTKPEQVRAVAVKDMFKSAAADAIARRAASYRTMPTKMGLLSPVVRAFFSKHQQVFDDYPNLWVKGGPVRALLLALFAQSKQGYTPELEAPRDVDLVLIGGSRQDLAGVMARLRGVASQEDFEWKPNMSAYLSTRDVGLNEAALRPDTFVFSEKARRDAVRETMYPSASEVGPYREVSSRTGLRALLFSLRERLSTPREVLDGVYAAKPFDLLLHLFKAYETGVADEFFEAVQESGNPEFAPFRTVEEALVSLVRDVRFRLNDRQAQMVADAQALLREDRYMTAGPISRVASRHLRKQSSSGVWYHGMRRNHLEFQVQQRHTFGRGSSETPLFFTPDESFAKLYAAGPEGTILKVRLKWRKVFDAENLVKSSKYWPPEREDMTPEGQKLFDDLDAGKVLGPIRDDDWSDVLKAILRHDFDVIETTEFKRWLKQNGYDAAYVTGDGPRNVFVFRPDQIEVLDRYPAHGGRQASLTPETLNEKVGGTAIPYVWEGPDKADQNWQNILKGVAAFNKIHEQVKSWGRIPDHKLLAELGKHQDIWRKELRNNFPLGIADSWDSWLNQNFGYDALVAFMGAVNNVQDATNILRKAIDFPFRFVDEDAPLSRYVKNLITYLDQYVDLVNGLVLQAGPRRFQHQGFPIENPDRLPDATVQKLLNGVAYVVDLFKRRGVTPLLQETVKSILLRNMEPGEGAHGWHRVDDRTIELMAQAAGAVNGKMLRDWVNEIFLHEVGHHVHLVLMHPAARAEWNSGWLPVIEAEKMSDAAQKKLKNVTVADRKRFWALLTEAKGNLRSISLKGLDRMKFHAWLREPLTNDGFVTDKQLRWSKRGERLRDFLADPDKYMSENYGFYVPQSESYTKALSRTLRQIQDTLGVLDVFDHPTLTDEQVAAYAKVDEQVAKALDALQAPTEYAKTNEREDFAESFVAFMAAPDKLSDVAKYRMQRALSLSGLYGKPIMRLSKNKDARDETFGPNTPLMDHGGNKVKYRVKSNTDAIAVAVYYGKTKIGGLNASSKTTQRSKRSVPPMCGACRRSTPR